MRTLLDMDASKIAQIIIGGVPAAPCGANRGCVMKMWFVFVCAVAAFAQAAHAEAGLAPGGTKVDGFKIKVLAPPTKARLAHPTSKTGKVQVEEGDADGCTDPFRADGGLAGVSKYLCVQGKATATFVLKKPATKFKLLWGSPDSDNYMSIYDTSGKLINTINGGDLDNDLKISNSHDYILKIQSRKPIGSMSLTSTTCCFEMDNLRADPNP